MSCVLIYTSPARGHLYPILDVALELRRAGHRVVVQTLAQEADHVQSAGLHHRAIAGQIEAIALADYRVRGTKAQLEAALSCWSQRAVHEVADLRASISRLAPDLLITDANCWGAAALAESTGRPWAMYLPYCLPVPSVDAPAFGPGLSPPRTAAGRLRDRVIWAVHARLAGPHVGQLNSLRAQIGVPQLSGLPELYQRSDLLLYRTAEPFEYPRSDWPAMCTCWAPDCGPRRARRRTGWPTCRAHESWSASPPNCSRTGRSSNQRCEHWPRSPDPSSSPRRRWTRATSSHPMSTRASSASCHMRPSWTRWTWS